jgi:hypothetical protein
MIDEKRLDELATGGPVTNAEIDEILRLARLGLWAREHEETIRDALDTFGEGMELDRSCEARGKAALAALPKEGDGPIELTNVRHVPLAFTQEDLRKSIDDLVALYASERVVKLPKEGE